jgi:lysozyme
MPYRCIRNIVTAYMDPIPAATTLIRRFEGLADGDPDTANLDPYLGPVGIWTIGWGHVVRDHNGHPIRGLENKDIADSIYPNGLTMDEAVTLLQDDMRPILPALQRIETNSLEWYQWAALISFSFNVGVAAFKNSTMKRLIDAGDLDGAADQFALWDKSGGQVLAGLVKRRAAEAALFRGENLTP